MNGLLRSIIGVNELLFVFVVIDSARPAHRSLVAERYSLCLVEEFHMKNIERSDSLATNLMPWTLNQQG